MIKVFLEEVRGQTPGRTYIILKGSTRVGRKNADIEIDNPRISSVHAEIHYGGTRVFILDRNSTNGTFVNGNRVKRTALKDGDLISLGGTAEKAVIVYKLKIEGEINKVVYILKKTINFQNKYLYLVLSLFVVLFFVWLFIPAKNPLSIKGGEKPWEKAEELIVPSSSSSITIALGDTISPPDDTEWRSEVKYELSKNDDIYEPRIYVVDLWNELPEESSSSKVVEASITVQRFKKDFIGNIDVERIKHFIWHEKDFLKDNGIDKKFTYSKTPIGVWQWVIWLDNDKFALYASCVTQRGRILLQASSFDLFVLRKFFESAVTSYKEGTMEQ